MSDAGPQDSTSFRNAVPIWTTERHPPDASSSCRAMFLLLPSVPPMKVALYPAVAVWRWYGWTLVAVEDRLVEHQGSRLLVTFRTTDDTVPGPGTLVLRAPAPERTPSSGPPSTALQSLRDRSAALMVRPRH